MIRRSFFQLIAGAFVPRPNGLLMTAPARRLSHEDRGVAVQTETRDPEWLTRWKRLPRLELLPEDVSNHPDPHQRELATQILPLIQSGTPFTFLYQGGSDPGTPRQVLPVLLFSQTDEDNLDWEPDMEPIYLHAWCLARNAPRTFRLDRMCAIPNRHAPPRHES